MIKTYYFFLLATLGINTCVSGQVSQKIQTAFNSFLKDDQMKYASAGFILADAETGKIIFSHQANTGLASASTLKVMTASAALEKLGSSFQYKTEVYYTGAISNGILTGDVIIRGSGDPSLGTWRYGVTKDFVQLTILSEALKKAVIQKINGNWRLETPDFDTQNTPGGWTFDDMGNYYGAAPGGFNWYENQYDLVLKPGKSAGQPTSIVGTKPIAEAIEIRNELLTGAAGSGDQAIIYPDRWPNSTARGTIPAGVNSFTISGSIAEPFPYFIKTVNQFGVKNNLAIFKEARFLSDEKMPPSGKKNLLCTLESPALDSLVYFFLQKSVNLYGEALVKQLAIASGKTGSTETGVDLLKDFWKARGIPNGAMRIFDGSGLSPSNRVTPTALLTVMQYARKQPWFNAFYEALPTINELKMKSGSISGVRAYTGYITAYDKRTYSFAFIVNNFDGSSSTIMQKMFRVLNSMK